jgi:hypothetical protein
VLRRPAKWFAWVPLRGSNRTLAMQQNAALSYLYFSAEVLIKYALARECPAWRNGTPAMKKQRRPALRAYFSAV